MLKRLRDLMDKNRHRMLLASFTIGGSYFLYHYFRRRFFTLQSQQMRDFMSKTRRVQHFESTERTCNQMIVGVCTEMLELINKKLNVCELVRTLQTNPKNKLELWEEIKVLTVSRLTTIIYGTSIVMVMLRIQLNLLGGYMYRDIYVNGVYSRKVTEQLKQSYLSILHQFMNSGGLDVLIERASEDVRNILKDVPLNRSLTAADLDHMFWAIQMSMNNSVGSNPFLKMCEFVLAVKNQYDTRSESYKLMECLLYETMDIIETDDTVSVCAVNAHCGFNMALNALAKDVGFSSSELSNNGKNTGQESNTVDSLIRERHADIQYDDERMTLMDKGTPAKQIPLAKIIPLINSLTDSGHDDSLKPENFITKLVNAHISSEKGKVLGANVYETFSSLPIV